MPKFRALSEIHYLNNRGEQRVARPNDIVTDFAHATIESGWLVTQGFVQTLPDEWIPPDTDVEPLEKSEPPFVSPEDEEALLPPDEVEEFSEEDDNA